MSRSRRKQKVPYPDACWRCGQTGRDERILANVDGQVGEPKRRRRVKRNRECYCP